jgi:hypothetical protein
MLSEDQLEALRSQFTKIGVVDYNGHQIVFRRPTRDHCREYRRMRESPAEKHEATERLAQVALVAFDGETDVNRARTTYTNVFLDEYPLFASVPKVMAVLSVLTGMVEEEDAADLGKGASVRSVRPRSTPAASPNGSGTAPEPQPS